MAVNERDRLGGFLERLFHDRVVRGTAEILDASPPGRGRWQKCRVTAVVEAEGYGPETVTLEYVMHRDHWPVPGSRLLADVHVDQPERTEIVWPAN